MDNIPRHVAIIMDGNGRWAQERGLPRIEGHRRGANSVDRVISAALSSGIPYVTLYAFSLENWKRPKEEVGFLFDFLISYLDAKIEELTEKEIALNVIGRISMLPGNLVEKLNDVIELTKGFDKLTLTLALSYGGRGEIIDAVKAIVRDSLSGGISPDDIDEEMFGKYLYDSSLPDPDLVIRTSGELRISNFLLWQSSYSELYFFEKYWPDFNEFDFFEALKDYSARKRKFGGIVGE